MIYAPIVIPTLNRIEHLKRCICSLQNNLWAQYTPLIISVDYPPSEKYTDGYDQICEYLKKGICGFKKVDIIYQEQNLGARENEKFLLQYAEKEYDRYIFTEDDNEFSPNFIEYIDKGLELFENDDRIMAICANGVVAQEDNKNNVVLSQNYTAYGCGMWFKKRKILCEQINRKFLADRAGDVKYMLELACRQAGILLSFQSAVLKKEKLYQLPDDRVPVIDQTIKMYLIAEHKYVINACKEKVRNWGLDGSGVNCPKDERYNAENIRIDDRTYFSYCYNLPMKQYKMRSDFSLEIICRVIVAIIKLSIWNMKVKIFHKGKK